MTKPPTHLSKRAKNKFVQLAPYLTLSNPLIVDMLARYAAQYDIAIRCEKEVRQAKTLTVLTAKGASQENAAVKMLQKTNDQMRRLASNLVEFAKDETSKEMLDLALAV